MRELDNTLERLVACAGNDRVLNSKDVAGVLVEAEPVSDEAGDAGRLEDADQDPTASTSLEAVLAALSTAHVDPMDDSLNGAKPKLDAAVAVLTRKLAGAALDRCRDQGTQKLNRQQAMRLLMGDPELTGKAPRRILKQIVGSSTDAELKDEHLEELVRESRAAQGDD